MTREVMEQALEALEAVGAEFICDATHHHKKEQHGGLDDCPNQARHDRAITAIREALAQPEQRKPLDEWVIDRLANNIQTADPVTWWRQLARAIEAAHGIKENT